MDPDRKRSMATARVGEKGQLVIPKEMRDMFVIRSGDSLILLADTERGIAIMPPAASQKMMDELMDGRIPSPDGDRSQ